MLGLVVIRGFGEVLRKTDVEADHRRSGMVRRFDLLDAIVNLSSKPISACQPSRRAAAEENHHNTEERNQREVKRAAIAKAVGTALHNIDGSTNIVSRAKRYAMWIDLVFGRLLAVDLFPKRRVARVAWLLLPHWDSRNNVSTDLLTSAPYC